MNIQLKPNEGRPGGVAYLKLFEADFTGFHTSVCMCIYWNEDIKTLYYIIGKDTEGL